MKCKDATLSVRFPKRDYDRVMDLVNQGYAMNATDFVRQAIREKIARVES